MTTYHLTDGPGVVLVEIVDIGRQEQPIVADVEANECLRLLTIRVDPVG